MMVSFKVEALFVSRRSSCRFVGNLLGKQPDPDALAANVWMGRRSLLEMRDDSHDRLIRAAAVEAFSLLLVYIASR